MHFDGPVHKSEEGRLKKQHETIRDILFGGQWLTLKELSQMTGYPEASISAQLRHLRKERFGAFIIEKRRVDGLASGLWEYHLSGRQPVAAKNIGIQDYFVAGQAFGITDDGRRVNYAPAA